MLPLRRAEAKRQTPPDSPNAKPRPPTKMTVPGIGEEAGKPQTSMHWPAPVSRAIEDGIFEMKATGQDFVRIVDLCTLAGNRRVTPSYFLGGRWRHIMEEYTKIKEQEEKSISVVGGFIAVEWMNHFFPKLKLTIIDYLPLPLGPLPPSAARFCPRYMALHRINQFHDADFWKSKDTSLAVTNGSGERWSDYPRVVGCVETPGKPMDEGNVPQISYPDEEEAVIAVTELNHFFPKLMEMSNGVKASNYFMSQLSETGSSGGGRIRTDTSLAVTHRSGERWSVFGDDFGCVETPGKPVDEETVPPILKISYPGEEEAVIAVTEPIMELSNGIDKGYARSGVKASNYFMSLLSETGSGGGDWIRTDTSFAVTNRSGERWSVFGDYPQVDGCNCGYVETPGKPVDEGIVPPIPNISYPGEEEAVIAVTELNHFFPKITIIDSLSLPLGFLPPTDWSERFQLLHVPSEREGGRRRWLDPDGHGIYGLELLWR